MQPRYTNLVLLATGLAVLSLAACSGETPEVDKESTPSAASASPAVTELSLLLFPDYLDEKTIRDFDEKNNARLRMTIYDSSEEMESKLAYAGADSQYDVVVMATHMLPRMVRRGLVRELDHSQLPELKNLEPRFSGPSFDDGNKHGVPYLWGTLGIMYDKQKFPNLEQSWSVLFDPQKIVGTFEMVDEMRDMLGVVLKYKGFSTNTVAPEELREAGRVLKEVKKHPKCLGFKSGVGATQDVKGGSVDMAVACNGDARKVISEDKDRLAFFMPKEGSVIWVDVMTIPPKAPHPELAYKFINHILTPETGAQLSLATRYASPNAAARAKLPPEERNNLLTYPPQEVSERLEYHRELGEGATNFDEVWTEVKSQ